MLRRTKFWQNPMGFLSIDYFFKILLKMRD